MLGNKAAMKISKIPMSNDTIHMAILKMPFDIEKNICGNKLNCFESTDITDKVQLLAFIHLINKN